VQNHDGCAKNHKKRLFLLSQSETSIFHDEEPSLTLFPGEDKARMVLEASRLQSPPSCHPKTKKRRDKHTNNQNKERPAHSKFKFQIQIARNRTERCEKDRTAIINSIYVYLSRCVAPLTTSCAFFTRFESEF
jgi:hypothetical protein